MFSYIPMTPTATKTISSIASLKIRIVFNFALTSNKTQASYSSNEVETKCRNGKCNDGQCETDADQCKANQERASCTPSPG